VEINFLAPTHAGISHSKGDGGFRPVPAHSRFLFRPGTNVINHSVSCMKWDGEILQGTHFGWTKLTRTAIAGSLTGRFSVKTLDFLGSQELRTRIEITTLVVVAKEPRPA
jgi:hypothetical protein